MPPETVSEDELNAYLDGALAPERRAAVEAYLAAAPEAAARLADYKAHKELLHTLYDPVLEEPVPARLGGTAALKPSDWPLRAAAAAVLLVFGGLAGWWLHDLRQPPMTFADKDLARHAAIAHAVFTPEVRHPVEVTAAEEAHLVRWLSNRLKAPLKAPILTDAGFGLVGGRLLSDATGPAGLFMYEDGQGRRLTLYVRESAAGAAETAFRYVHDDGVGVFYWVDTRLSYALAGQLDKNALLAVARAVYNQLEQ